MSTTTVETITADAIATDDLLIESILRQVDQLPRDRQLSLAQSIRDKYINPVKPPLDKRVPCDPMPDETRERAWIEEHKHEYAGQWVALDGDRLIAASPNRLEISAAVKTDGARLPLILRIPSPDDLPPIGI